MNSIFLTGMIVISEIMFDPDPPVGLPAYEFVELYNPGTDTVDLTGWQWMVGDKVKRFTLGLVNPGDHVIVCSPSAAAAFRTFGTVVPLESFPALRNTGDRLVLIDPDGIAVHTVDYSPQRFTDALKAAGGWSLELTDAVHYCDPSAWQVSVDPSGGTPGRASSVNMEVVSQEQSKMLRAAGYDDDRFVVLFNGILSPYLDMNKYASTLMPGNLRAMPEKSQEFGYPGLFFHYPDGLDRDSIYSVGIQGEVSDCSGRNALLRSVQLGFPSDPAPNGLVISEILFDPLEGQPEFVEIFNRSGRVVELKDLILARADADGRIIAFSDQQDRSYWLFPGCYAVFTADAGSTARAWPRSDPAAVAGRSDMPSLNNDGAVLILMDRYQTILDQVTYLPDWHYPYLEETRGVSLERIDFTASGMNRENWLSASAASGFSTPGAKNSCDPGSVVNTEKQFYLDPSVGYAHNPDYPVQIVVHYRFDEPGWFLRLHIYTANGLPVREIFPFGMAGSEGVVCWDGLDAGGNLLAEGIYLVIADYHHPSGAKGRWKGACALVRAY